MTNRLLNILFIACSLLIASSSFGQATADDKLITDYLAKNNIKATRTASGLYYVITSPGKGDNAKPGQNVKMNYLGKLLDGTKFDGNVDENFQPVAGRDVLRFTLGIGRVIKGWDEGVQMLNPGARGILFIPSVLGYGSRGAGNVIPPNAVLVFNVELVGIE